MLGAAVRIRRYQPPLAWCFGRAGSPDQGTGGSPAGKLARRLKRRSSGRSCLPHRWRILALRNQHARARVPRRARHHSAHRASTSDPGNQAACFSACHPTCRPQHSEHRRRMPPHLQSRTNAAQSLRGAGWPTQRSRLGIWSSCGVNTPYFRVWPGCHALPYPLLRRCLGKSGRRAGPINKPIDEYGAQRKAPRSRQQSIRPCGD